MTRLTTAALITLLLAVAGTATASSAMAVASAHVIRATIVTTDPLVKQLSVTANDLHRGYISLDGATVGRGKVGATAFTVRVEIPSMQANTSFSGDAASSSRVTVTGTEASLRQNPFAYITYDGQ
jgi:hypothetical protein